MTELSKKIKIVYLLGSIKNGKKTTLIDIKKELFSHIFETLPQYLLDVHKYKNADKKAKIQLFIKTQEEDKEKKSLYKRAEFEQYICGIVEKGITGKRKQVLDSKDNKVVGEIKNLQAVLSPVFFMLIFSWKLNSLFLITENDAPENIYSDITSAIRASITNFLAVKKITLKSEVVLGSDKVIDYIKNGQYSQIKIKRKKMPADIADRIYNIKVEEDEECTVEIKINTKKKDITGKLVDKIRNLTSDGQPSFKTMEELEPFGLNEDSEIIVDATLNGNKRPISISKLKTPNISQVIKVLENEDGHADFESITKESLELFKDIVNYM